MFNDKNFLNLFRFRGDTFSIQTRKGEYIRMYKSPTHNDLKMHFDHNKVLAMYPVMNDKTYLGILDFDVPKKMIGNKDVENKILEEAKECWTLLDDIGVKSKLFEATGGRGWHIWVFSDIVPSHMMYTFLRRIVETAGSEAEIFPINDSGLGKPIRLPLGTHKVYKGKSQFIDIDEMINIVPTNKLFDDLFNNRIDQDFLEKLGIYQMYDSGCNTYDNFSYKLIPKVDTFDEVLKSIRPCFRQVYLDKKETENSDGWNFMTAAAAEILANGGTAEHVHKYFSVQKQYNKAETTKNLRPIMRKNLYPFSCKRLQEVSGSIVDDYCAGCHINYHNRLNESLENAVDRSEDKEERSEGTIDDTLKQFDAVAFEMNDILTKTGYTVLSNTFNGGKSWATIKYIDYVVHTVGKRINFIMPHRNIKNKMIDRLTRAKVNFLDTPSSLDLCLFSDKFQDIGYVPTGMCKKCHYYAPIREMIRPIMERYIDESENGFFGTLKKYREIAIEMDVCPKWIYMAFLVATVEENLCLLTTSQQIKHQMFIESAPLFEAMSSPQLHCNVIDQIDFVNRNIPRLTIYDDDIEKYMRHLGIFFREDNWYQNRISVVTFLDTIKDGDIISNLDHAAVDFLKQWIYSEEMYDASIYRKVWSDKMPHIKHYEFMGENVINMLMNDTLMNKFNVYLYDSLIDYIKNQHVECADGLEHVPISFKSILENITKCDTVLGITSTPGEMENLSDMWISSYHNKLAQVLKNLYSLPNLNQEYISEDAAFVYTRKADGESCINDGSVRGDTGTGGHKTEVVINDLQFPKNSEAVITDIIHLCGGNIGKGIKIFYENIINDAITQAHEYEMDKIIVPNPDLFVSMGFQINDVEETKLAVAFEKFKTTLGNKDFVYRSKIKNIDSETLDKMIERGMVKMNGQKCILGE
jgi:hypothetical protein